MRVISARKAVEIGRRETQGAGAAAQALEVPVEKARAPAHDRQRLEQPVAVQQAAIERVDPGVGASVDENPRHCGLPSARSRPLAFARVSSSSRSGSESATMPAPARSSTSPSRTVMVRMRMLRSRLPSSPR